MNDNTLDIPTLKHEEFKESFIDYLQKTGKFETLKVFFYEFSKKNLEYKEDFLRNFNCETMMEVRLHGI